MDPTTIDAPRLRRLIEVGRTLVARLDLEGVLEMMLEAARDLTGARYAAFGVLDEGKHELDRFLTLGIDERTRAAIGDLPRGRGLLGELIRHPEPLRLAEIGSHPSSHGFPPGHPVMHTFLGVPIRIRGDVWGNLYLTEKEGGAGFDESDESAIAILADWAAIAVENARLYEGLARRRNEVELQRDQAERSAQALAVMTDIARSVGGETDIDHILELIVDRGRVLVQASALLIMLADGDGLVMAATAGALDAGLRGTRIPAEGTLCGTVLRSRRAKRLGGAEGEAELGELGVSAEAAIIVPLTFRGVSSGVLVALDRTADGPEFGLEDERLLRSFAASAATAVATAKSVEAERLRHNLEAAEQERKRWARELHDETLQALGGLRMLHSAALRGDAGASELRAALREGIGLIDTEIDNLSALIAELRPAALDEIGLVPALRTLAERKGREGDITVDVLARLEEEGRLPAETESVLYRLVQEALNNVVKHAGASRVEVVLERAGDLVEVSVRDDGRGFDPAASNGGFGLIGMRERVELAGGELRMAAAAGQGTTVSATIPLQPGDVLPHRSSRPRSST
ncbi:MAG: GAF domain-containing protein [Solirubrobacterales bacterium]